MTLVIPPAASHALLVAPWGILAFCASLLLTLLIRRTSRRIGLVDQPDEPRRIHVRPVPLGGGIAIFFALVVGMVAVMASTDVLTRGEITRGHYVGFLLGGFVLIVGGWIDDRFRLPPRLSFVAPVIAAACAIAGGIEVDKLTNPFGGAFILPSWQSDMLVFAWLLVVMYTTKLLDGLDGLATGISAIGSGMVMLLALTAAYYQPDVAVLSAIALGALLGFLLFNFHPASIFLGEGGSTFVGYLVGVLAVISGGKVATALLVLGIPLLDVVWIILRRWRQGGPSAVFRGDKRHLHHRLLDLGWSQRQVVMAYYVLAAVFGISALFLQSREKVFALGVLVLLMGLGALLLIWKEQTAVAKPSSNP
ncbi:undecaprenyl/decaprenyl-phosphate alpha-N-acetylglucosaminyl 1-phosphate transferase [Candidatus Uhrbacteria bacterium]|nr:undecaprenyl/decaprenyl-phosphate alpha-N-acetylglucosaminyl 1-phosphate transferase [Candidatus Uhrbacteria bacterium]